MAAGVLHEAEDAGEVDVDDGFPVFFRVDRRRGAANDAGVVDENVDGAEVLDGFFNEARADVGMAHVAGKRDTFVRRCLATLCCVASGACAGAVNGDVGARLGKRDGDGGAEAARGAGDQREFAVEVELFEYRRLGSGEFVLSNRQRSASFRFYLLAAARTGAGCFSRVESRAREP